MSLDNKSLEEKLEHLIDELEELASSAVISGEDVFTLPIQFMLLRLRDLLEPEPDDNLDPSTRVTKRAAEIEEELNEEDRALAEEQYKWLEKLKQTQSQPYIQGPWDTTAPRQWLSTGTTTTATWSDQHIHGYITNTAPVIYDEINEFPDGLGVARRQHVKAVQARLEGLAKQQAKMRRRRA